MTPSESDTKDHLQPPSSVAWWLRVVILLQCVGVSGRYLLSSLESESDVYGLLFFDLGWQETFAQRIDDWGVLACFTAGCVIVLLGLVQQATSREANALRGRGPFPRGLRTLECLAALFVSAWFLTLASCHMVRGDVYAQLSLGEHAVRFTAPLVFVLILWQPSRYRAACAFAAIAATATFVVHGYKALDCYGPFTDLILLTDARWFHFDLEQSTAENSLVVVGAVDILVAGILLTTRWRWAAAYMVLWGLITSASRTTAFGWSAWPETLIRAANWGVPLAALQILSWEKNRLNEIESPTGLENHS